MVAEKHAKLTDKIKSVSQRVMVMQRGNSLMSTVLKNFQQKFQSNERLSPTQAKIVPRLILVHVFKKITIPQLDWAKRFYLQV